MEKQLPLIQNIDEQARNLDNNIGKLFSTTNNSSAPIINTKNPTNDIVVERGFITSAISLLTISQYERDYLIIDGYLNTALYCFRTYLEITMKDTLLIYNIDQTNWGNGAERHNLAKLWQLIKPNIGPMDDMVDSIERVVKEISDADKLSTSFRYPYSLNKLFPKHDTGSIYCQVDVQQMKQTMLQLYRFFEGINDEANVNRENNKNYATPTT